jgi:choline dehydrogenase-like flavoprotein
MQKWNTVVIGSGFGGAFSALPLVHAGERVLMVERGGWVGRGPDNWSKSGPGLISSHYARDAGFQVAGSHREYRSSAWNCVGGQSVFYGAASYRFRESDFAHHDEVVTDSGAEWPFRYDDLEAFYGRAEILLGVAGEAGCEPGEPPRSSPFPQKPAPLANSSAHLLEAAQRLGLTPSRIPLAISYDTNGNRRGCMKCGKCDGYACASESKNDLATGIIPGLMTQGMTLRTNTICVRLRTNGRHISAIDCVNRVTGERETFYADRVIVAAGTLATPHLLLASGLARMNPAGSAVGRYLTRHCNKVVLGAFRRRPNPTHEFDKQIAILDMYKEGGSIQQLTASADLVRAYLPPALRTAGAMFMSHTLGLVVISEDQPRASNVLTIDTGSMDRYGLPALRVHHEYSDRDERIAMSLVGKSREILHEAGALFTIVHPIRTFTHALGTVRMGCDAKSSPLDVSGRYRGIDNLFVTDGSALPRSAGLNPSLTIAANALRVGSLIAGSTPPGRGETTIGRSRRHLPAANIR